MIKKAGLGSNPTFFHLLCLSSFLCTMGVGIPTSELLYSKMKTAAVFSYVPDIQSVPQNSGYHYYYKEAISQRKAIKILKDILKL